MQFICYPKCSTCQKARKWLEANHLEFTERHIEGMVCREWTSIKEIF